MADVGGMRSYKLTQFGAPLRQVIESPPAVGFAGAPHWWRIFTGLASTPHPPLYHLALRFWVDIFGDGDFAVRSSGARRPHPDRDPAKWAPRQPSDSGSYRALHGADDLRPAWRLWRSSVLTARCGLGR